MSDTLLDSEAREKRSTVKIPILMESASGKRQTIKSIQVKSTQETLLSAL